MSDNDIYPEDPQDTALDLDDVEGHGLKEVAAGLGAAAVLAGGAAGATQLAHSASSADVHASKGGPGISVQVSDPIGTLVEATDRSIANAQDLRDGALAAADHRIDATLTTVANLPGTVDRTVDRATDLVQDTGEWAADVKDGAVNAAKGSVSSASSTARSTTAKATTVADNNIDRATNATSTSVNNATTTASSTASYADRKVATVLSVVTTTSADAVHTAKVTLKAVDAGAGANSAGGWVLIKDGDKVLAQVQMVGGSATASWTMPVLGSHGITVSYTGDSAFAPSIRAITL